MYERYTCKHYDWLQYHIYKDGEFYFEITGSEEGLPQKICDDLNSAYVRNRELTLTTRKLCEFILSKGYTLDDFNDFIMENCDCKKE